MGTTLNDRQQAVLEWIAGGCRAGEEPVERYKHTAASLEYRGLVRLERQYGQAWRARLTPLGRYWLEHQTYPPAGSVLESLLLDESEPSPSGESIPDVTFINRRRILASDWVTGGRILSYLTAAEQWALHAAYKQSKADMSDDEALAAYRVMERDEPERIIAAEAAGARFVSASDEEQDAARRAEERRASGVVPKRRAQKDRNLQVQGLVRPELDLEQVAKLLIRVAMQDPLGLGSADDAKPGNAALERLLSMPWPSPNPGPPPAPHRKPPAAPARRRTLPPAMSAKIDEGWSCLEAGSYLATVLVARSTLGDVLADNGAPVGDGSLIEGLASLADQQQIPRGIVDEAATMRGFSVVPNNPPAGREDATPMMMLLTRIIGTLYTDPPDEGTKQP